MPMRVPTYQPEVEPRQGSPIAVPNVQAPPPAAFGTDLAAKAEQTGNVISGLGEKLAGHMIERERMSQEADVLSRDMNYRKDVQDVTDNLFQRQLANAKGVTVDYDTAVRGIKSKHLQEVQNPYALQKLQRMMDETDTTYRRFVIRHEASQIDESQKNIFKSNMQQRIDQAGMITDPDELRQSIRSAQLVQYGDMKNRGFDSSTMTLNTGELAAKMVESAIRGTIYTNPDQSQKLFDQVKGEMPKDRQEQLQRAIDESKTSEARKNAKYTLTGYDSAEASLAGALANGKLTQFDLDQKKGEVTDDFYKTASTALLNYGKPAEGTSTQQSNTAITLMKQFVTANSLADPDKRTAAIMKYRKDVLATQTKLPPEAFQKLLGWSDPNFVAQIQTKPGWKDYLKAGSEFITNHYQNFMSGPAGEAMMNFIHGATHPNVKAEDVPKIALEAVKPDIYKENPSLLGQPELSNNTASQKSGVKQIFNVPTTLKPQQTIKPTGQFKAGDEQTKAGIVYVRGEDGKWRQKPKS